MSGFTDFSSPVQCILTDIFEQWSAYTRQRVPEVTTQWRNNLKQRDRAQQKRLPKMPPVFRFKEVFSAENDPDLNKLLNALGALSKHAVSALVAVNVAWMKDVITQPSHIGHRDGKRKANDNVNEVVELREMVVQYLYCVLQLAILEHFDGTNIQANTADKLEDMIFEHFEYELNPKEMAEVTEQRNVVDDLFAQLLGKISIFRSDIINEKYFSLVKPLMGKKDDKEKAAILTKAVRHIHLDITTEDGIARAEQWFTSLTPIFQDAKIESFKHSIMDSYGNMCRSVIYDEQPDVHYGSWYQALFTTFTRTFELTERGDKHALQGYPASCAMLACLSPELFDQHFTNMLDLLYKCLKKKDLRIMAMRCINTLVEAWYRKFTDEETSRLPIIKQIWSNILAPAKRKEILPGVELDLLTDFLVITADAEKDFTVGELVEDLLTQDHVQRHLLALRAFNRIADNVEDKEGSDKAFDVIVQGGDEELPTDEDGNTIEPIGLSMHLESLTALFSALLKRYDGVVGGCTIYNTTRPLKETLVRDFQYMSVDVILEIIGGLPRVIPMGYQGSVLYGLLAKYTVHYSTDVRREAYLALSRMFNRFPKERALIVHSYSDWMIHLPEHLDNFVVAGCLQNLHTLLLEWVDILRSGDEDHSVYDLTPEEQKELEPDNDDDEVLDRVFLFESKFRKVNIPFLESLCLVIMHSTNCTARSNCFEVLEDLRTLYRLLVPTSALGLVHERMQSNLSDFDEDEDEHTALLNTPRLYDVIEESGDAILLNGFHDHSRNLVAVDVEEQPPPGLTLKLLAGNDHENSQKRWTRCLGELGKTAAAICPAVVGMAWVETNTRITNLGMNPRDTSVTDISLVWRNHLVFAFATAQLDELEPEEQEALFNESFQGEEGTLRGKPKSVLRFEAGESTMDLLRYALQFMDADTEYMRETITIAVAHLPTNIYPLLFHEIGRYEEAYKVTNTKKKIRDKDRKDRLRNEVSYIYRIVAENAGPDTFRGYNRHLPQVFYNTLLEYFNYLRIDVNNYPHSLQPLRYNFCLLVKYLCEELPEVAASNAQSSSSSSGGALSGDEVDLEGDGEEEEAFFTFEARQAMFKFLMPWCGLRPYSLARESEQAATLDRLLKPLRSQEDRLRAEHYYYREVEAVEHRAVEAMAALLNGRAFNPLGMDEDSTPEIEWLDTVVCCNNDVMRQHGINGLQALISFNYAFMEMYLHKCYVDAPEINMAYFAALVEAFSTTDELPITPAVAINLLLHKSGDRNYEVRRLNQRFYDAIMLRYFSDREVTGAFWGGSTLTDTMQSLQRKLSTTLARFCSELTNEVIQEMVKRLPVTAPAFKVQALAYIVPWMGNLDLDTDRDGTFDPQMETTIQTMLDISVEFGEEFFRELAQVWERVSHNEQNVIFMVEHLVDASLEDPSPEFLQTAKKIAVWLARGAPAATTKAISDVLLDSLKYAPMDEQIPTQAPEEKRAGGEDDDDEEDDEAEDGEVEPAGRAVVVADEEGDELEMLMAVSTMADFSTTTSYVGQAPPEFAPGMEPPPVSPEFRFTRTDLAMLLGVEIINELEPSDFAVNLHTLVHVAVVKMDDLSDLVLEHAKILLSNILHGVVLRELDSQSTADFDETLELVNFVQSKPLRALWDSEDTEENERLVLSTSARILQSLSIKADIQQAWSDEAVYWGNHSADTFLALRSFQVFRAVAASVNVEQLVATLQTMMMCLDEPTVTHLIFAVEIAKALQVMVAQVPNIAEFPQVVWACLAMMKTNSPALFTEAVKLLGVVLDNVDPHDESFIKGVYATEPESWKGSFRGVLPFVVKGLTANRAMEATSELLVRCLKLAESELLGKEQMRPLLLSLGLTPMLAMGLEHGEVSEKAAVVAQDLSAHLQSLNLEDLARVFMSYSEGEYTTLDFFVTNLVEPLVDSFGEHELVMVVLLCQAINNNENELVREVTLALLHEVLKRIEMREENFSGEAALLFRAVSKEVTSELFLDALPALHVASHRSTPAYALPYGSYVREDSVPALGIIESFQVQQEATFNDDGYALADEVESADALHAVLKKCNEVVDISSIDLSKPLLQATVRLKAKPATRPKAKEAVSTDAGKAAAKPAEKTYAPPPVEAAEESKSEDDVFDMFAPPTSAPPETENTEAGQSSTAAEGDDEDELKPKKKPKTKKKKSTWQKHVHKNGRVYYYNRKTKKTQWTKPEDYDGPEDEEEEEQQQQEAAPVAAAVETSPAAEAETTEAAEEEAEPEQAQEEVEPEQTQAQEQTEAAVENTKEEAPMVFAPPPLEEGPVTPKLSKPKKSAWREVQKDGKVYYYNKQTRSTQWKKPAELEEYEKALAAFEAQEAGESTSTSTTAAPAAAEEQPQEEEEATAESETAAAAEAEEEETSSSSSNAAAADASSSSDDKAVEEAAEEVDPEALAPGWKEVTSKDGRKYYYHRATKKTQWKKPLLKDMQSSATSPAAIKAGEELRQANKKWRKLSAVNQFAFNADLYDIFPAANNVVAKTHEVFMADLGIVQESVSMEEITRSLKATPSMGEDLKDVLDFLAQIPAAKGEAMDEISARMDELAGEDEAWLENFKAARGEAVTVVEAQMEAFNSKKRSLDTAISDLGLMANEEQAVKQHQEMYLVMQLYDCNLELLNLMRVDLASLQSLVQQVVQFDEEQWSALQQTLDNLIADNREKYAYFEEKEGKAKFRQNFGTHKKKKGTKV